MVGNSRSLDITIINAKSFVMNEMSNSFEAEKVFDLCIAGIDLIGCISKISLASMCSLSLLSV